MLLKLPTEIILNICSHLRFRDKLYLKATCHQLNNNITNAVLYETFYLLYIAPPNGSSHDERERQQLKITQILQDDRLQGSLVKVLHISLYLLPDDICSQLPGLFPNVKRIITSEKRTDESSTSSSRSYPAGPEYITQPLTKWRNTIEKIDTGYDWHTLRDDLLWFKYPRLTELDLGNVFNNLTKWIGDGSVSFFTNAPLLKKLTLRKAHIDPEVLEAIHTGFPLLESLRLFTPYSKLEQEELTPQSVTPASSVLYFGVFNSFEFNKDAVVLDYILKKYTCLQQLVFGVDHYSDYFLKTLAHFENDSYTQAHRNKDEMIANEIARTETEYPIYSAIESNFFSKLPNSLKKLTLKINNIDNAVAALAESDSKITALDLLDYEELYAIRLTKFGDKYKRIWKDPNMLENFNKLTSLKVLKIPLGSSVQAFTPECISSTITRLVIGLYIDTFSIEWVLSKFPSLEELEINPPGSDPKDVARSSIKERDDEDIHDGNGGQPIIKEHRKLRILSINKCTIHPSFFSFIKRAVPNLNELNLEMRLPTASETTELKVDLSCWSLNKFNLSFIMPPDPPVVCCVATIQNVSRCFEMPPYDNHLMQVGRHYKYDRKRVWVEVISDHIKHLKIIGFYVVKIGEKIVIDISK